MDIIWQMRKAIKNSVWDSEILGKWGQAGTGSGWGAGGWCPDGGWAPVLCPLQGEQPPSLAALPLPGARWDRIETFLKLDWCQPFEGSHLISLPVSTLAQRLVVMKIQWVSADEWGSEWISLMRHCTWQFCWSHFCTGNLFCFSELVWERKACVF